VAKVAYAVLADLEAYIGEAPADAAAAGRMLGRAQDLIDYTIRKALFAVDNFTDGNPTDPDVLNALKQATCAQVESWLSSGDELDELGQWQTITIEGITLSRRTDDTVRRERLCQRARDILYAPLPNGAPLLPGWVSTP
jgi:hypothetical protein